MEEVQLHEFLTFAAGGDECSVSRPAAIPPGKETPVPNG